MCIFKHLMANYKEKSLNLTTSSHVGWSQRQALKELIVNSIDEHDELEIPLSEIKLNCYTNCFIIKDRGRGVKLKNFCQGNSTKKDKDLRGFHGQGLRGSISRLLLEGHDIYIKSSFIDGKFEVKEDIKILYDKPTEKIEGTEIRIFFKKDDKSSRISSEFGSILSEVEKDIIYFKQSYDQKIEEIKCRAGTLVDVYIPNVYDKIYKGGFFFCRVHSYYRGISF